jgi:hypothetical protein
MNIYTYIIMKLLVLNQRGLVCNVEVLRIQRKQGRKVP